MHRTPVVVAVLYKGAAEVNSGGKLQANTAGDPEGDCWLTRTGQYHVVEGLHLLETVFDFRKPIRPSRVCNDDRIAPRRLAFVVEIAELARIRRHAQHQEFATERVIDLAGIDPTRRRDDRARCEQPARRSEERRVGK